MKEAPLTIAPRVLSLLSRVAGFFQENEIEGYVVGGFIRDTLLGRATADIDIAMRADALKVAGDLAGVLAGRYVRLDELNQVARIVLPGGGELDFSTIRDGIRQDLALRDFTVNALALPLDEPGRGLEREAIVDPFSGTRDLERRIIRAVSPGIFQADGVRLLRAIRLAAELDFQIEPETRALIKRDAGLVAPVAGERIREEFLRILALPRAGDYIANLDALGLLTAVIPELGQARNVEQPVVHYWDVFRHSMETVSALGFLLHQAGYQFGRDELLSDVPWSSRIEAHFAREVSHGSTRQAILKLAGLLHDIAKPQTKTTDETGRTRFLGHSQEGASVASAVLDRLRFSAREIKLVGLLVTYHLRPGQLSQQGLPSKRAIYRYFRDTGEAGIDVLFLSLADHLAARGPRIDMAQWREHTGLVRYVLQRYFEEQDRPSPVQLLDGHDIINIFGLSEGPLIGELLEAAREAQAAGEIATREEALKFVARRLAGGEAQ
ncbi:MAG: HD domain-containing protein [Chloroflexi bacterium]|nr:HD domain-containing protein [Chloroflexota bacterium]